MFINHVQLMPSDLRENGTHETFLAAVEGLDFFSLRSENVP